MRCWDLVMRIGLLGAKEGISLRDSHYEILTTRFSRDYQKLIFQKKSQFPQTIFFYVTKNIINDDLKAFPVGFAMVGGSS